MSLINLSTIIISFISLLTINCIFSTALATPGSSAQPAGTRPALTVSAVTPRVVNWPVSIPAIGEIRPWQEAIVAAEIGGLRVAEILVDVGDRIRKDQLLVRLAPETVETTLAQRRAEVAQAQAVLGQASADAERARRAHGAISEQQEQQYLVGQERAKAALEAAQAAQRSEELRLEKTRILAIDNGIITERSVMLGTVVQPGTELFRFIRRERLEWLAGVTAVQLAHINPRQRAKIVLPNGQEINGQVRIVDPDLEPQTRKGFIHIDIPHNSGAKAGMFVRGEIILEQTQATVLPASVIVLRDGFQYLFTVDADRVVHQHKITTGRLYGDTIEVLTPLDANAEVVLSGGAFLEDGDKVQVVTGVPTAP